MRRVALAGVLAMQPSILILDEPTTGLDADARSEFYYYLHRVQQKEGATIILVSHDMAEVATLANWLYVLYEGRLVLQGSPRTVFTQHDVLRQWGLAVPPLSELLTLLRQQGLDIPEDVFTLDEAFHVLLHKIGIKNDV
jgi:energy-coupling factor transport system ATP-binding protein